MNLKKCFLSILVLCACMVASAQNRPVSGTVTDAAGQPIIGASIIEVGNTRNVAITDLDGKFSLTLAPDATIQVSYIGFVTQDIPLAGRAQIDVILSEDTEVLDEVVVVGYGVQRKSDLTGAISQVKAEDLEDRSITTLNAGLQGKTAGVHIVTTSGAPGAESSIRVRGYSSNSESTPLYVVDGLRTKNISFVDPSDIESIEVLKDAASAAIYGAQAGNGVVLVLSLIHI